MNKAIFRYVEFELYNFENTKKEIELMRQSITESTPEFEYRPEQQSNLKTRPTEVKGIKLASSPALVRMERTVRVIEMVLQNLGREYQDIYHLKYNRGMSNERICAECHMGKTKFYEMRRKIVEQVARSLGLINSI